MSSTTFTPTTPLPQILTYPATTPPLLITLGAEAHLYKSSFLLPTIPCAIKYRPPKPYRHPTLDARLTKHRILSEARVLVKLRKERVPVPAVFALDEVRGWVTMEWIEGGSVRNLLEAWLKAKKEAEREQRSDRDWRGEGGETDGMAELRDLMHRVGRAVGKMHAAGVVHGDLTTSNLMLRPNAGSVQGTSAAVSMANVSLHGEIVLIDFGLASQSIADEDRAVDLYVLERAFGSTHPRAEGLFGEVLLKYGEAFRSAGVVLKRLEEVRQRGRKRSMLG